MSDFVNAVNDEMERLGPERCWNCVWLTGHEEIEDGNSSLGELTGWCKRFPPVYAPTEHSARFGRDCHHNWSIPAVQLADWCGEFSPAGRTAGDFINRGAFEGGEP